MAKTVNRTCIAHAVALIRAGKVDADKRHSGAAVLADLAPSELESFCLVSERGGEGTEIVYAHPVGKDGKVQRAALVATRRQALEAEDWEVFDAAGRLLAALDGQETGGQVVVRAVSADETEILLYGFIGDYFWDSASVTALDFLKQLNATTTSKVTVRIASDGGVVMDGLAIANAMRRHQADITAVVDSAACSIASLIAVSADRTEMAANSLLMVHAPWSGASGNAAYLRSVADELDTFARAMAQDYVAKTGKSMDEIMGWLTDGNDHWFTAEEAIAEGLADAISQDAPAQAAEARLDLSRHMARAPARIAAALKPTPSSQEDTIMPPIENPQAAASDPKVVDLNNQRIKARNDGIRAACKPFHDNAEILALQTEALADPSISEAEVNQRILAILGKGSSPANPAGGGRVEMGETDREKRVKAMVQGQLARAGVEKQDGANEFRGMKFMDLARFCLQAAGINTRGMDPLAIAKAALSLRPLAAGQSTSDFPVLLENTMHKLVLTGFQAAKPKYPAFCKIGTVTDFRDWNRLVPGLLGNLDEVLESGEYKNKNLPDAVKNAIRAKRHGNIISVTPETLINDDLGTIQDMARGLGQVGPRAIDRAVFAVLAANPVLSDGIALFHASHGNLAGAGAAPSVTTLDAARVDMSKQTAPGDDAEYLDISPAVGVTSAAVEGTMRVIVGSAYDPDANSKLQRENMVKNLVQTIVGTPRVADNIWYLFADPNNAPVIEVVFLDGQAEPRVTMEENFKTSGLDSKVELPFGAGAIDFRGGYKNPGA